VQQEEKTMTVLPGIVDAIFFRVLLIIACIASRVESGSGMRRGFLARASDALVPLSARDSRRTTVNGWRAGGRFAD
jgi:hypothetical protein